MSSPRFTALDADAVREATQAALRLKLEKPADAPTGHMMATLRYPQPATQAEHWCLLTHQLALSDFGPEAEKAAEGFPVFKLTAPVNTVVSTVLEDNRFQIVLAHSAARTAVNRVEALVYSPWEKKESPWAYVAKAEGWEHQSVIKMNRKRHILRARWDSPQQESKQGEVTVRGLLAHLPFLCNGPVQYQVNEVTNRIYWVHVIDLSGWQAILQVNCCAPTVAFEEQMAFTCAQGGDKLLESNLPFKTLQRYAVASDKAFAALSDLERPTLDPIFGELKREIIAQYSKAERHRLDAMGERLLYQVQKGEAVDAVEAVELLVVMLGGLWAFVKEEHQTAFAASGKSEADYRKEVDKLRGEGKMPSADTVREWSTSIVQSCRKTSPLDWWRHMVPEPFASKEFLVDCVGEDPGLCCLPFLPEDKTLKEILDEARESDYVRKLTVRPVDEDAQRAVFELLLSNAK